MHSAPDGTHRAAAREKRRIEWAARRREVQRILAHPERIDVSTLDLPQLWDQLWESLYVTEANAERMAAPELLVSALTAKAVAFRLYEAAGRPLEAA